MAIVIHDYYMSGILLEMYSSIEMDANFLTPLKFPMYTSGGMMGTSFAIVIKLW